jgi:ligand-binding sensor domain-containing protein
VGRHLPRALSLRHRDRPVRQYRYDPADSLGLPEPAAYDVFRDRTGAIWAVTENFLVRLIDAERGRFQRWRYKERATAGRGSSVDGSGRNRRTLARSDQGLVRFDPKTATFRHYRHDPRVPSSLSHDAVRAILPDPREPNRFLWIGTAGGGLNRSDHRLGHVRALHRTRWPA